MTTHRERLLGQARADLTQLPDLCEELARILTERPPVDDARPGKPGSRPPLRLDVLHLVDLRRKPDWQTSDPRDGNLTDRYGVAPLLESWVRVVCEELPGNLELTKDEAWVRTIWGDLPAVLELTETATVRSETSVLIEFWPFVEAQQWAEELADDVTRITKQVRQALGIREALRYKCPECGNPAYVVPGGILSCQEGHERVVRDLEKQQRRRPLMSTAEITAEYGVEANTLRQWKFRRRITPTVDDQGRLWWLPWDVFCILNPDIADALNLRDETEAG